MAQKLPFLFDAALYCEEQSLGEVEKEDDFDNSYVVLQEQDLFWGDEELSFLLSKEQENKLHNILEKNPSLSDARIEAVEWILKVNGRHNFSAQTALLAVNYLDRFLASFQSQTQKPWMSQLAAVACICLAAKVEETQVPLLLDFQVEESKFVYEAKTIERMELLVLSNLQWQMNPVTPFTFLDYIARRLGLKNDLYFEFLRRCGHVIISTISDCRFMCYLPSVMASATMLHVIKKLKPCIGSQESQEQQLLLGILGINMEKVEECHRLIREVASEFHYDSAHKRKMPVSPKGVMDVSFSSDSSNDSWAISSSPEQFSKKTRIQDQQQWNILSSNDSSADP